MERQRHAVALEIEAQVEAAKQGVEAQNANELWQPSGPPPNLRNSKLGPPGDKPTKGEGKPQSPRAEKARKVAQARDLASVASRLGVYNTANGLAASQHVLD